MGNCSGVISLFSLLALKEKGILKWGARNDIVSRPILIEAFFGICCFLECLKLQVFFRTWKILYKMFPIL